MLIPAVVPAVNVDITTDTSSDVVVENTEENQVIVVIEKAASIFSQGLPAMSKIIFLNNLLKTFEESGNQENIDQIRDAIKPMIDELENQ